MSSTINDALVDENPFVAVVARKVRNLKKKLDKINKCESQLVTGKDLNEEQKQLLANKSSIVKALTELESIKNQLEDVAKLHPITSTTVQEIESNKVESDISKINILHKESDSDIKLDATVTYKDTKDIETMTDAIEIEETDKNIKTDASQLVNDEISDSKAHVSEENTDILSVKNSVIANEHVKKLLKVMHVYSRYTNITNRNLPPTLIYFSQTLLGLTSILGFQSTLQLSMRTANVYFDTESAKSEELISGVTYEDIEILINQLSEEMEDCYSKPKTMMYAQVNDNISTSTPAADIDNPVISNNGGFRNMTGSSTKACYNEDELAEDLEVDDLMEEDLEDELIVVTESEQPEITFFDETMEDLSSTEISGNSLIPTPPPDITFMSPMSPSPSAVVNAVNIINKSNNHNNNATVTAPSNTSFSTSSFASSFIPPPELTLPVEDFNTKISGNKTTDKHEIATKQSQATHISRHPSTSVDKDKKNINKATTNDIIHTNHNQSVSTDTTAKTTEEQKSLPSSQYQQKNVEKRERIRNKQKHEIKLTSVITSDIPAADTVTVTTTTDTNTPQVTKESRAPKIKRTNPNKASNEGKNEIASTSSVQIPESSPIPLPVTSIASSTVMSVESSNSNKTGRNSNRNNRNPRNKSNTVVTTHIEDSNEGNNEIIHKNKTINPNSNTNTVNSNITINKTTISSSIIVQENPTSTQTPVVAATVSPVRVNTRPPANKSHNQAVLTDETKANNSKGNNSQQSIVSTSVPIPSDTNDSTPPQPSSNTSRANKPPSNRTPRDRDRKSSTPVSNDHTEKPKAVSEDIATPSAIPPPATTATSVANSMNNTIGNRRSPNPRKENHSVSQSDHTDKKTSSGINTHHNSDNVYKHNIKPTSGSTVTAVAPVATTDAHNPSTRDHDNHNHIPARRTENRSAYKNASTTEQRREKPPIVHHTNTNSNNGHVSNTHIKSAVVATPSVVPPVPPSVPAVISSISQADQEDGWQPSRPPKKTHTPMTTGTTVANNRSNNSNVMKSGNNNNNSNNNKNPLNSSSVVKSTTKIK